MHALLLVMMAQELPGCPLSICLQILAIDGRHQETLLRYVRLLRRAKQPNGALKHSLWAAEAYPQAFEVNLLLADCLRCHYTSRILWQHWP